MAADYRLTKMFSRCEYAILHFVVVGNDVEYNDYVMTISERCLDHTEQVQAN